MRKLRSAGQDACTAGFGLVQHIISRLCIRELAGCGVITHDMGARATGSPYMRMAGEVLDNAGGCSIGAPGFFSAAPIPGHTNSWNGRSGHRCVFHESIPAKAPAGSVFIDAL